MKDSSLDEWKERHYKLIKQTLNELDLPKELEVYCFKLWDLSRSKSPRIPTSLIVDCVYTVAHISGNRRSLKDMMAAAKVVLNRKTKPFNQDKRVDSKRWIETDWAKDIIFGIAQDPQILEDLLER